ncbi:tetratricopeptide repeat protein [Cytophaga hutchinsonii]|uniref:Uncharacterized protein n=1 Tax=Cytophaga hutchinsonii (strain ATCC 33406 / DSM 1761 / CIP 103989 / NBRC 15051 / NCIMB 9469 / D465) TaxID=269798 RepID=A0A6N4SRL6_CYTH3|nr:hypothetical protein [Cytophaga hutchinsonii]ABG58949.1 conserved hypothetical protein [Cytophaga hutchinsonii ATCC 33406]SFX82614.1 Tetratricopeptide repeat-containing protein [Cytophaga hutchinsonii ATCC 33406]
MSRFLTFFLIVFSYALQAQVASLTNAILYRNDGNLIKAKEEIDKAVVNEKTIGMPKTWFYTGLIYKDLYQATPTDLAALTTSTAAFKKVFELEKPAGEFSKKSQEALEQIWAISINNGVNLYQLENYRQAITDFERAQGIKPGDTTAYVYAFYAANELKDQALLEKYSSALVRLNYASEAVYYIDIESLMDKNLLDSAYTVSKKALTNYPSDIALKTQQTELMVKMNKTQEAIENLKVLSTKNPKDVQLLINIGSQYTNLNDEPHAAEYYQKALAIDSVNFNANYNMAVFSLRKANEISKQIVVSDNNLKKSFKAIPTVATDPLRQNLQKELAVSTKYYNRAVLGAKDEEAKKNVKTLQDNITSFEDQFLK